MDRHKLSDVIPSSYARFGGLACILQILWRQADRNERKHARLLADYRAALNYHVRLQPHAVFQLNIIANNRERSHLTAAPNPGIRADNSGRVNVSRCGGYGHANVSGK